MSPWRLLLLHFRDREAEPVRESMHRSDLPALTLVAVNTVIGLIDGLVGLSSRIVTAPFQIAPLLALVVAFAVAVTVVCRVRQAATALVIGAKPRPRYHYPQFVRIPAKIAAGIALCLIPISMNSVVRSAMPLPRLIGGYLVSTSTGVPLVDANIRLLGDEGQELKVSALPSDAVGFYTVQATSRISRTTRLLITWNDCPEGITLSLARAFEIGRTPRGTPLFRHLVKCGSH
jgi:hypothetical protein